MSPISPSSDTFPTFCATLQSSGAIRPIAVQPRQKGAVSLEVIQEVAETALSGSALTREAQRENPGLSERVCSAPSGRNGDTNPAPSEGSPTTVGSQSGAESPSPVRTESPPPTGNQVSGVEDGSPTKRKKISRDDARVPMAPDINKNRGATRQQKIKPSLENLMSSHNPNGGTRHLMRLWRGNHLT